MKKVLAFMFLFTILSSFLFGCVQPNIPPSKSVAPSASPSNTPIQSSKPTQSTMPTTTNPITENIKLFYGSSGNEKMVAEERQISYTAAGDKYKLALETLIAGPTNPNLHRNIPSATTVYGTIRQNDAIIIDLSSGFSGFPGSIAEIIAVGSIVNTMTQFDGIDRVKILVEGEDLIAPSGKPRGFMKEFPLQP